MLNKKLSLRTLWAYGAPELPMNMVFVPIFAVLPALYQQHTTATLAQIGVVMMVARLFDTVTDLLIGMWSDRTKSRLGQRKPWIIAGGIVSAVSVHFLFNPDPSVGAPYYMVWSLLAYLGWTMVNIPRNAWAVDLTKDYHERNSLITVATVLGTAGACIFYMLAYLPIFATTEMTMEVVNLSSYVIVPLLVVTILINVLLCPQGNHVSVAPPSIRGDIKSILHNKPFWCLNFALLIMGIGAASGMGLSFIFIDGYLKLGDKFSTISLITMPIAFIGLPIWNLVMKKIDKHKAFAIGGGLFAVLSMMIAFLKPGPASFVPYLIITIATQLAWSVNIIAAPSMMMDCIDYDTLKTGTKRAASYIAFNAIVQKAVMSVGAGIGLVLAGLAGYEMGKDNTPQAEQMLIFIVCILPSIFYLLSFYVIWKFPITSHRSEIIQRRIKQKKERKDRKNHLAAQTDAI